jgi:hypothetical protein
MIFTVPLQQGTTLANVVYRWIALGAIGAETATGITQPWSTVPVFRIDSTPPTDAEELVVYDSTNTANWTTGGYAIAKMRDAISGAAQLVLASLYQPGAGVSAIVPANPAALSICRCYGTFNDLSAASADGLDVTFTLVAVDNTDPTIVYDMSATPIKNTETGQLVTQRVVTATLVAGQIQDKNGNNYVDLTRNDFMSATLPANSSLKYLLTSEALGAPAGLSLATEAGTTVFTPVFFRLDTATLVQAVSGTFDLSKNAVT